jgi:hypothetical protein
LNDIDYETLDPGIRETVRHLRAHGFNTTDSGDGITKPAAGWPDDEVLHVPHVAIVCDDGCLMVAQADRLMRILATGGVRVLPQSMDRTLPSIQASYDPADGTAVIILTGVSDGMWP